MTLEEAVKYCEEHECDDCPVHDTRCEHDKKELQIPCCLNLVGEKYEY